ncbi:MAG: hypothetical protein ACJ0SL_08610 [Candidatus Rariloculaceae bacterium]
MKPVLATLLVFALIGPVAAQDEPFSIEGLALRNARLLVAGMAFGLGTYDDELAASEQSRLYCPPDDVSINGNYLWELAEAELSGDHDLATVATTVLQLLQDLYPCTS